MGNAVAGEKTEEVKSKTDPAGVTDVAINRGERFVNVYSFNCSNLNRGPKNRGRR